MGYYYNLFPAYTGWTRDQLSIGRHPPKDLKLTELCLGPIHTRLETFLGFLSDSCQIVARKSEGPSSGKCLSYLFFLAWWDLRGGPQSKISHRLFSFQKIFFSKTSW